MTTKTETLTGRKKMSVSYLVKVAMMGTLAYVIMLFEFAIPIFPGFLKMDFSDLVPLLGSLALGPVAGMLIQLLKCILHFLTANTTGGVGDLANFLVGSAFVMAAGAYYQHHRTQKGAYIGLALGTAAIVVAGALVNYFITIPLYGVVLGLSEEAIVGMGSAVIPAITNKLTLILYAFCPFNLLKGLMLSILTIPLYKHVSPLLQMGFKKKV